MTQETEQAVTAPPIARKQLVETSLYGQTLRDEYAWLRDKNAEEVTRYLEAENAHTDAVMAPLKPLTEALYREMLSHVKETDVSVAFPEGDYFYYSRTEEGLQYPVYCRKRGSLDAPEEIVLDVNALAAGHAYYSIGSYTVSDDGNLVAYSSDTTGFRQYTLHIKDLRTGEVLADTAERVGSVVWASDNTTLFYTVEDEETKRQHRLYRHRLGDPDQAHILVYEEFDERFNIGAGRTRDGKYLILEAASHTTSEERFLPANTPTAEWQLIEPRRDDIEYDVEHRDGDFLIRVNDTGRNFRLVTAPVSRPGSANWKEVLAHRENVMLEEVDVFATFTVVVERQDALPHLRLFGTTFDTPPREISFPEPVYSAGPHINRVFDTTAFRYSYQSLVTPASVFEFDIVSGESKLLKQLEIPGGFDRTQYRSERIWAPAADGTRIPISIVYRADLKTRTNPLYVYGYGSYGYSLPVGFNASRLSLLDRGVVMAYAHIRGGGDMGKPWHDAGRLMVKRNTFTDFISATEELVKHGYGDPHRIAVEGGSAGGLLMGAIVNLRPDLFRVVMSHVPFVDVMNTMLDASLPLTVAEYEEWGNPNEPEAFEYMLSYSPYDNLKAARYPAMLVKTSLNDSQVMYWEPAKYVAKLRTLKQDSQPLLLHTNMNAGHGGASGRYDYLKEVAFDYAFLLWQLGIVQPD
ncbi:MAG TPA: S9 family peptidase [Acidobacteriaceae bacterium]|nr:S9 family peptidase [Acidobacteriaceae bacterium]